MRIGLVFLLTFFYLLSSISSTINLHFCGGKIKSISIFSSAKKCCCGFKKKNKGCCENKTIVLKIDSKQYLSKISKVQSVKIISIPFISILENESVFKVLKKIDIAEIYQPPPLFCSTSIFIKNRVLII
jgi:hypothetical protein